MIRIQLPYHLRTLAKVSGEVELEVTGNVTLKSTLDALEAKFPNLKGTIRDHVTLQRRPLLRFYACQQDLTYDSPEKPLPELIVSGKEPLFVVGAIAGG